MTTTLIIAASLIALLVWLSFLYRVPDMSHLDAPEASLVKAPEHISEAHHEVVEKLRDYHSAPLAKNAQEARRRFHAVFSRPVSIEPVPVDAGGVPAEWIVAEGADPDRRLLYIHGGAFIVGSPETHRHITSEISRKTGTAVLAIDYRMRPEHKLTAAQQDTRTACQWILEQGPSVQGAPAKLFIAGDSAGGNLALSLIAWARDKGIRAADGVIAFAPLTDMSMSSPTWRKNLHSDHFLGPGIGRALKVPALLRHVLGHLQGGIASNNPVMSPLLGPLNNLPPTLIQVSRDEMLYGDALRYANKAATEGSEVILEVWPTLVHVFQGFAELPEADEALDRVAAFVQART